MVNAQLRLRRAFRYGYFAFLAVLLTLLALLGLSVVSGALADMVTSLLDARSLWMAAALALGLSVPIFMAAWSLLGSALLGFDFRPPPIMDRVRE